MLYKKTIFEAPNIEKMTLPFQNTQLFYESYGSGPALVLLHGFLESSRMWDFFVAEFSATHNVITIDLPGHGASGCAGTVHSMEVMAEAVHAVTEALSLYSFGLTGHSMGGYVALAYVEKYPHLVSKLTLINSTPDEDSKERKLNRTRALKVITTNKDAFISMAISNLFTPPDRTTYASEIELLKQEAKQLTRQGITAAIKGMRDRKDRREVLKNFEKEKRMLCGTEDPIVPLSEAKQTAAFCETELKVLSGGHMSWIESPKKILKIYT